MLEPKTTLVVTDRDPDFEIAINGHTVYDSHETGHLPNEKVIELIADFAKIEVKESDWLKEPGDEHLHITSIALRIGEAHNMRTWCLDRAPHEDAPTPFEP